MELKKELKIWIEAYSIPDEFGNTVVVDLLTRSLEKIEELEEQISPNIDILKNSE